MDEEEEIDIVGNYEGFVSRNEQDLSKISSGQILSCDYTVHPNWLNENAEDGNYWTDSVPKSENLESNVKILHSEEVVIEEPEPVRTIADVEWATEATSHEDLVFEDDIPASIEEIVMNHDDDDDYISKSSDLTDSEHFKLETAAFETHPPPKNLKFIGPTHSRSLLKVKMELPENSNFSYSSSKRNPKKPERVGTKFKKTLTVNRDFLQGRMQPQIVKAVNSKIQPSVKNAMKVPRKPVAKFKQTVNIRSQDLENGKFAALRNKIRKYKEGNSKRTRRVRHWSNTENITISHELDKPTATVPSPVSSGVVLKLEKCESDTDVEIDIESDASLETKPVAEKIIQNKSLSPVSQTTSVVTVVQHQESSSQDDSDDPADDIDNNQIIDRYTNISAALAAELQSNEIPTVELRIHPNEVSDLEKFVHSDFFENRMIKTPEQYLRIRNHILNMWNVSKPNYISKTAVRSGLKHGGDVNCISRIHRLLEQIGAINFDCDGKYFEFIRPLETFISMFAQTPRNRSNSSNSSVVPLYKERRHRIRSNTLTFNNDLMDDGANYTIVHMDGVIRPIPEPRQVDDKPRSRIRHIKSELDLVKCLKFTDENSKPFKVSITLSTVLCLQLHALSSTNEVMGFLGGHRVDSLAEKRIDIIRYKPCKTTSQSMTTCEMCPVSQVEQFSNLKAEGYELLGWFHSHPLFLPNPSHTDIRTQKEMQSHFALNDNRFFVGVIFSCLNMSFKCIYMMPDISPSDKLQDNNTPYEIDISIRKDCDSFKSDVKDVFRIVQAEITDLTELLVRFKTSSDSILKQFGYNSEIFFNNII